MAVGVMLLATIVIAQGRIFSKHLQASMHCGQETLSDCSPCCKTQYHATAGGIFSQGFRALGEHEESSPSPDVLHFRQLRLSYCPVLRKCRDAVGCTDTSVPIF